MKTSKPFGTLILWFSLSVTTLALSTWFHNLPLLVAAVLHACCMTLPSSLRTVDDPSLSICMVRASFLQGKGTSPISPWENPQLAPWSSTTDAKDHIGNLGKTDKIRPHGELLQNRQNKTTWETLTKQIKQDHMGNLGKTDKTTWKT